MESQVTATKKGIIRVEGIILDGKNVKVSYQALTGSNPKAKGYFVAIWQDSQIGPINTAIQTQKIESPDQTGTINFRDLLLGNKEYIIGFGVNLKNDYSICATLSIPADVKPKQKLEAFLSSVEISEEGIGTDSLFIDYATPEFNQPSTNKNWVALFPNTFTANCFTGANVMTSAKIDSDNHEGSVPLDNLKLRRFSTYTVVYGIGYTVAGVPVYSDIISFYTFSV